jgi:transposase
VVPFVHPLTAHLAEFGIVAPIERNGVEQLLGVVADANDNRLSANKGLS